MKPIAILFLILVFTTLQASQVQQPITSSCPLGPYVYHAKIKDAYDADTVTADIDLGFHTWRKGERLRLYGIDAPEVRGNEKIEGKISRDWLRSQVLEKRILIKSVKSKNRLRGKYGRYLVVLYLKNDDNCINLNDELVRLGYAEYREY